MRFNCIRSSDTSSGAMESVEYPFVAITLIPTLIRSGRFCWSPIYNSNRLVWKLLASGRNNWCHINVCTQMIIFKKCICSSNSQTTEYLWSPQWPPNPTSLLEIFQELKLHSNLQLTDSFSIDWFLKHVYASNSPVGWGCRLHRLLLCRGIRLPQRVSWIWY